MNKVSGNFSRALGTSPETIELPELILVGRQPENSELIAQGREMGCVSCINHVYTRTNPFGEEEIIQEIREYSDKVGIVSGRSQGGFQMFARTHALLKIHHIASQRAARSIEITIGKEYTTRSQVQAGLVLDAWMKNGGWSGTGNFNKLIGELTRFEMDRRTQNYFSTLDYRLYR